MEENMDQRPPIEPDQSADCVVCGSLAEEVPPCSHGYCWDCLNQLIRHACEDGERWPPRCCVWEVNIDAYDIRQKLFPEVARLVESSKLYYSTPNKLFCCNSECRSYIPPADVDKFSHIGFCKACWGGTCSLCRRHPHIGNCKKDFQQKAMEKYLIYRGWKRCEQCGSIVEKTAGCNHMVCNCGEEFCYVCGQHWRNCGCPQFGEHKLEEDLAVAARPWFQFPPQPRCYGKEFLVNTCLPQTFFCAKCGYRCGRAGEASHQCQDCGRHLCKACVVQCLDDGRYHNPDWNAEPAEALGEKRGTEEPTTSLTTAQPNMGETENDSSPGTTIPEAEDLDRMGEETNRRGASTFDTEA